VTQHWASQHLRDALRLYRVVISGRSARPSLRSQAALRSIRERRSVVSNGALSASDRDNVIRVTRNPLASLSRSQKQGASGNAWGNQLAPTRLSRAAMRPRVGSKVLRARSGELRRTSAPCPALDIFGHGRTEAFTTP
jgi:hypothetical protein